MSATTTADLRFPCPHCKEIAQIDLEDGELSGSTMVQFDCEECCERISIYASLEVSAAVRSA